MSSISASSGKSLSKILILSPILNGKEKNKMIPAVTLLKIDHCAKKATPMIVSIEEITRKISSPFTPQIIIKETIAKVERSILMYFQTRLVRASVSSDLLPKLFTNELRKILNTK